MGTGLTSIGRLTGLVASDLLLVQVLLMARIPLVEKAYGQDELARRHRWVGFTSFNLMLVHTVAITLGYAAARPRGLWGTIVDFVLNYAGLLLTVTGSPGWMDAVELAVVGAGIPREHVHIERFTY